ncbi:MAG: hypothetical protein GX861_01060 [Tenericutes bacterium]|nr:hypothetical protein [Mycoplasmatota bacterium]
MIIKSFIKEKKGMYKLVFDNNELVVHEDLILKYSLLNKKELNIETIKKLSEENQKYEIYNMALNYINKRLRSKQEIDKYLETKNINLALKEEILNILTKQNYLNDAIYIKAFINDQINMTKNGPLKVRKDLIAKGISEELIDENMFIFTNSLINKRIEQIIEKKRNTNKNKGAYFLKQKILLDLINMGYLKEDVLTILNKMVFKDNLDIYQKEYAKLYKTLSKKYSGIELDYQIKQRLYQKGFRQN